MVKFKQQCNKCKKNYVTITSKQNYALCYECQKDDLKKQIRNPEMKKLFDIPEDYYKENSFLRNIKLYYIKFGSLTEKQIEAFKKNVERIKKEHHKVPSLTQPKT
ncbi:MAG: hypothetical protein PHF86_08315 [Candidatus Nanoarchaeia archaeon]|nr:hypothetical protein [Candidatus Nanoarchaeia archaeon]